MPKLLRQGETVTHQPWLPQTAVEPEPLPDPAQITAEARRQGEAEAEVIIAAAHAEATEIRARAYDEGLAEGRAAGEQEYQERFAALLALVEEINQERDVFFDQVEAESVRLATTIAEKVIMRQLSLQPEIVVDITRGCLKRIRDREEVFIRINPDDLPLVTEARPALLMDVDGLKECNLIEDRRVGRGGVVIETKSGSLDARLSAQLEVVEKALRDAVEGPGDAQAD